MLPAGFEPTISADEQPQTYALDRAATGAGIYIYISSSYRPVNTLHLSYENQSVNVVQGNNRCLFSDPYKTHKYSVCGQNNFLKLNTVVHKVTTGI